eukprot:5534257-Amphidinium_carterae.1
MGWGPWGGSGSFARCLDSCEVAEYIDLLQLDVARNKKYRMDTEERERVVMQSRHVQHPSTKNHYRRTCLWKDKQLKMRL